MMETIEQKAFNAYEEDRKLPTKYQTPDNMWMDWYKKGYQEAHRWISISDKLPPDAKLVLIKIHVEMKDNEFDMYSLADYHSFINKWNIIHQLLNSRKDVKSWKITHWRFIE